MNNMVKIESLPAKEFFVLRGVAKLYDEGVQPDPETDVWRSIRQRITDGSVERLKKAACSETVYILFCNTCVRNDEDKCYDCSYDIACENLNNQKIDVEFEIVRLNPCEYAVVTCEFDSETSMRDAHEKPDSIFWGEWLKENPYTSAIDDLVNWRGNGYASIEQYSPFDPDTEKFVFKVWFPILRKESERAI